MPSLQIPEKLKRLVTTPKRFKILIGGRNSAKSTGVSSIMTMRVQTEGCDLICLREFQSSIAQSVHKILKNTIDRTGAEGFTVLDNKITCGKNEIIFAGMARNSAAIKSAEDFKYSWVEEAQTCSQQSLDDLLPTIRKPGSELWFTANPQSSEDPFSKRFIVPYLAELERDGVYEDDLHLIVVVNWRDNPWHGGEMEELRQWDFENRERAEYDHIWEGKFNDTIENSIIKAEWFDAAIDAHIKVGFKPRGQKVLTHDPSDSGDAKAYMYRHGNVILQAEENTYDDVNDGCDWALDQAIALNADVFRWDIGGLGLSLKRQVDKSLKETKIKWDMFSGAETAEDAKSIYEPVERGQKYQNKMNGEIFRNKRAQCYWKLRDRFYNTYRRVVKNDGEIPTDSMISISSDIKCLQKMRSEICRIPLKNSGTGLIQIMAKDEMKNKLKIESPNLADCAMMSEANPMKLIKEDYLKPLDYNTVGIL